MTTPLSPVALLPADERARDLVYSAVAERAPDAMLGTGGRLLAGLTGLPELAISRFSPLGGEYAAYRRDRIDHLLRHAAARMVALDRLAVHRRMQRVALAMPFVGAAMGAPAAVGLLGSLACLVVALAAGRMSGPACERVAEFLSTAIFRRLTPAEAALPDAGSIRPGLTESGEPLSRYLSPWDVSQRLVGWRMRGWLPPFAFAGLWAVPGALAGFYASFVYAPMALVMLILVVAYIVKFDDCEEHERARRLGDASSASFDRAGGTSWGEHVEAALRDQLSNAARDASPFVRLGRPSGIFAGRGDVFAAPADAAAMGLTAHDLSTHLLVTGATGAGKTSGVARPLLRQLHAAGGTGLIVLDGKGALPLDCGLARDQIRILSPDADKVSLIAGLSPADLASAVVSQMAGAGGDDNAFFSRAASNLLRAAATVAASEGAENYTLTRIAQIALDGPGEGPFADDAETQAALDDLTRHRAQDEKTRANVNSTLDGWLQTFLGHPKLRAWAAAPAWSGETWIDELLHGAAVGLLLPADEYGAAGPAATALLKTRLYTVIKRRARRDWRGAGETPVVLVMDEAQAIASAQDTDILPIARSLGLSVVALTQNVEGLTVRLGDHAAKQYLSLFRSLLAFRNDSAATAEMVAQRIGASRYAALGVDALASAAKAYAAADIGLEPYKTTEDAPDLLKLSSASGDAPGLVESTVDPREIGELTARPGSAIAILQRGGADRKDVILTDRDFPQS